MKLFFNGAQCRYEMENICRMFEPECEVSEKTKIPAEDKKRDYAYFRRVFRRGSTDLFCMAYYRGLLAGARKNVVGEVSEKEAERWYAEKFFSEMRDATGVYPPWGILTGVRPAKLAAGLLEEHGAEGAVKRLREKYLVREDKAGLAVQTAMVSRDVKKLGNERSFSLYVSIPFCPSRCRYCSFVSKSVAKDRSLIAPYLECLIKELAATGETVRRLGLKLETVYVGGGTPSVLEAEDITRLCSAIADSFDLKNAVEFTFEAGRPDTITSEKLAAIKQAGVTRLSINPQTAVDEVLRRAGRTHTAADTERCFGMARDAGFDDINADLIAGLPGDCVTGFEGTLDWILKIRPENVTVHALTLKRASLLRDENDSASAGASTMVDAAYFRLTESGYSPYYMYRQKGTTENLENVGYSLDGKRGLYNIYIMDELHTIIACGAGAVTKLKSQTTDRIERIFNYKYPAEYINGIDVLIERKKGILEFYDRKL